ncbi:MBL fold metallo-hydrolase [Aquimarina addita]|uniref:MBL fold metallo-hydrolase n=1 Tax=Aquimarina addita TaxID=870485 RepID=A0ABP7XGP5_9FLAO
MSDKLYYLKQNIQIEPLINDWYAWIQIIPPVQGALNIVHRHLPMMDSYISAPEIHASAVNNPAFRGGPFIDLNGEKVQEVKQLISQTQKDCESNIEFAKAIKDLYKMLETEAKGYSMEPLYEKVPEVLKGHVELVYDMNHNPSFRFFEGLLYKSDFYDTSSQSIAISTIEKDADRPFIFSTPRLENEDTLKLNIPFANKGLDELFKMKKKPQTLDYIKESLGVEINNSELFKSFFTEEKPNEYQEYTGDNMRIRYFGHACILVETGGVSFLFDPVLSYTYESDISRYTYEDLPEKIDYVLITHSHHDHVLIETMLQIRHKVDNIIVGANVKGTIQDPSLKLLFENLGFDNVSEIEEFGEIKFPGGKITGIPFLGEHHDLFIQSKICYLINYNDSSILSVADSCNIEPKLYEKVHELYGEVDVLFLGMECDGAPSSWVYGPLFPETPDRDKDYSRRGRGCNYSEGIGLVNIFKPKEVYVYAMGEEPWIRHILDVAYTDESNPIIESNKLIADCSNRGIIAERLFAEKELLIYSNEAVLDEK